MPEPDSNTRPVTTDDLRLRVAALSALQARVKTELDTARDDLHKEMRNGESHTVWSPLDEAEQIATVNRSKPKPKARVVDPDALVEWMAQHYPDRIERTRVPTAEGVSFLLDVAPELVDERVELRSWAEREVLGASETAREPAMPDGTTGVPGVAVDAAPPGRLSVRLSDDAERLIGELIDAGRIDYRGRPAIGGGS